MSMMEACKGIFFATNSETKAYLDNRLYGTLYQATVWTRSCSLVVTSGKCDSCKSYHPSLRVKYSLVEESKFSC